MSNALTVDASKAVKVTRKRSRGTADQQDSDVASSLISSLDAETRHAQIAEAAYFRAQQRGFAPGGEQEDWYAAETEIETRLNGAGAMTEVH